MNVFKNEIPKCFHDELVFATFLMINRRKSIIFLSKNCTLYEIQSLKLLHSINLKESFDDQLYESNRKITLGKYILNDGISKRFFILLKITDKLVILERTTSGLNLIKEFKNVDKFEISDPDKLYEAHIYIFYIGESDSTRICLPNHDQNSVESTSDVRVTEDIKIKELVKIIKKARTDLALKTSETKQIFLNTKNLSTFGCNFIRSHEIEEKMILSRSGDIWMQIHNDLLVIGIPIVNNCSERLITVQNIRPILYFDNLEGLEFKYKLYEIIKGGKSFNLDSLEYHESCHPIFNLNEEWIPIKIRSLQPESEAVITITLSLNNFYNLSLNEIICFIAYDIYYENQKFTQNLFVRKIKIDTEILYNSKYQLDFSTNSAINFLTIVETSFQHIFIIEVPNDSKINFLHNFKNIFLEQLKFKTFEESTEPMDIDNDEQTDRINMKIFYKFDYICGNFWYGTVIILPQLSDNIFKMKVYSRCESKTIALIQMLYKNSTEKIKIFPENNLTFDNILKNFQYALREEINLGENITKDYYNEVNLTRKTVYDLQKKIFVKELQTDGCIKQLK